MKVAFVQTVHNYYDDRVFFHQRESLLAEGGDVIIITANAVKEESRENLLGRIQREIHKFSPNVVVCDTPMAVFASSKAKTNNNKFKVVYDITEWYPSKKNLKGLSLIKKSVKAFILFLVNIYAGWMVDAFIFGESYKSIPFRYLFFWKKYIILPYYPDLNYFDSVVEKKDFSTWKISYNGVLSTEKGYGRVLESVSLLAQKHSSIKFELSVIGINSNESFQEPVLPNLNVVHHDFMPFQKFCKSIADCDIFLDLRDDDFENTRCLPIKLFYYMAVGKVSVYTKLKSISKDVPECNEFLTLAEINDSKSIYEALERYITDQTFYIKQCRTARYMSEEKYNWDKIKRDFNHFILDGRN